MPLLLRCIDAVAAVAVAVAVVVVAVAVAVTTGTMYSQRGAVTPVQAFEEYIVI